jgi:hypothetical protein
MTKQQHPITPPPELVEQWAHLPADWNTVAFLIAQWGADQELEACCEWMAEETPFSYINALSEARRPKRPSLKEQALAVLDDASDRLDAAHENIIRRALEQLDD